MDVAGDQAPSSSGAGVAKRFGALTVLDDVDFSVGAGEAVGIVGPNGAGQDDAAQRARRRPAGDRAGRCASAAPT